ncbi:uncharacterized protein LOC132948569 [Metopolophium dirhodum]|uniref:uncharacterized protein LOC132948569 n=1 Tax=Metopolophium dirhodum TaxID=44670 RepID=UPI0029907DF5|nr:uncharacterized protein LOC132948569 [Metopolophium dirhodum]
MNLLTALNVAVMATVVACLAWPATAQVYNMNRYGKQQLTQKQYRYGNPTWANGANRAGGWASSSYGNMMRHYPVSMARYGAIMGGGRQTLSPDDYYDGESRGSVAYDPSPRRYDRLDYAVVRYPNYGVGYGGYGGYGYYPVTSLAASGGSGSVVVDDDLLYDDDDDDRDRDRDDDDNDDMLFGDHSGGQITAARYPMTDKIHNFRKVFMSNLVSPSNAFKSPKERQLYDFWESLINGDLDDMQQTDDTIGQQRLDRDRPQHQSPTSLLYQHLPPIFLKLQQQQKQKLQNQQHPLKQHYKSVDDQTPPPPLSPPSTSYLASSSPLHTVPRGNFYKQWANGSPLIKRSSAGGIQQTISPSSLSSSSLDNDDVRQLRELKSNNGATNTTMTTSTTTTTSTVAGVSTAAAPSPPMADGGQREFVLPRPAGEKTGLESLLEVIAEGGLRGNYGDNSNFSKEAKVNKKRSFVSDETSLAAQLGALRKN